MTERLQALELANSLPLWIFCLFVLSVIVAQAVIFYVIGKRYSAECSITPLEMRAALKSGTITAMGPALSKFVVGLGLIASIGAPLTMAHANVAGNTTYEVSSAELAATTMGSSLTAETFSPFVFTNVVWVLNLGCICMMILPLIAVGPLTNARDTIANRSGLGVIIGASASMASFAYMSYGYAVKGSFQLAAVLIGFFSMLIVCLVAKKTGKNALKEWGYVIALGCAFIVVALFF